MGIMHVHSTHLFACSYSGQNYLKPIWLDNVNNCSHLTSKKITECSYKPPIGYGQGCSSANVATLQCGKLSVLLSTTNLHDRSRMIDISGGHRISGRPIMFHSLTILNTNYR